MAENTSEKAKQTTKKGDFVEIEFIGRNLLNNEVFDTNIPSELAKINPKAKAEPLIVCIGQKMVVAGFDEALENRQTGKKEKIRLAPEKAFGKRLSELVKLIPMKVFAEQKIYPQPGMTLALDSNLVRVVSVSSGRVLVDFNNPLAGKDIEYEFAVKRILSDAKEKALALQKFLFNQVFDFDVDEKNKKLIFKDIKLTQILEIFRPKFKEMLGYDVEIFQEKPKEEKSRPEKKDDKKEESK